MTSPPAPGLGYRPALDGVRALAVAAVFAYHAGLGSLQGGFVGVDVFFVLSGFLITGLLLAERSSSGGIQLDRFWARRARRLLPALLVLLLAMAAYAAWLAPPDSLAQLRRSALATLLYVANWAQLVGGQGYFARLAAPDPLMHTWSLAIEEQFYLLWPLAVLGLLRLGRGRRGPLLGFCAAAAVASSGAMALLFHGGAGVNRVYYGTDTRAQDLLVGAALAVVVATRRPSAAGGDRNRWARWAAAAAPLGLAGVLGAAVVARGASAWLYRGGFLAVALASALLIIGVVAAPSSPVARILALAPLRYLGRISYGVYLWHWPVILILDGARTGLAGSSLFLLRAGASVAVAAASYHLVEMPVRRPRPAGRARRSRAGAPAVAGVVVVSVLAATLAATVAPSGAQSTVDTVPTRAPSGPHLDAGVVSPLTKVAAGTGGPIRVLLVGDSMATTLAIGLGIGSEAYGVQLRNDGVIGCGLVLQGLVANRGVAAVETGGLRDGGQWVRCDTWPQRWRADVAAFHPDVVAMLEGAWEVRDRRVGGHWEHLGDPAFDRLELAALRRAVAAMESAGSRVVLLTSPYFSQPEQADGSPQPADQPARVDRFNQLLRAVAQGSGGRVTVLDLGARVCPGGRFSTVVDGVDMRAGDGLHFTTAGGEALRPWLLTRLRTTGAEARTGPPGA